MPGPSSQYFARDPAVASDEGSTTLSLADLDLRLTTDRGVFSNARIDAGTRLLLQEAPHPDESMGAVLDLGCGYGPIAVTLARRSPEVAVWAVDVNERAVALAARNAADNGCEIHAVVVDEHGTAVDGTPADVATLGDLRFDAIWSNPPIRIGKAALHELLSTWLDRLTPDGRAWLVVQKHLGADSLHTWLERRGHTTTRLCSRAGYRILEVHAR